MAGLPAVLIEIAPEHPQPHRIARAVSVLRKPGVIVYPTDTIYGLGCDLLSKPAIERIYALKGRPRQHPLSFICADISQASTYAQISNQAFRLMNRVLPGPYTFILPATGLVPKIMLTRRHTAGIRIPACPVALALVQALGNPIISTSYTLDYGDVVGQPWLIEETLGRSVDAVVDGGELGTEPSTVVDLTGPVPEIVRAGKGDTSIFE
jgi:tRNA threonylcarbamoyl adenosine modification protein (Sua5/YciO/YrdC/YwlC family)